MKNKGFICNSCKKRFRVPGTYQERHRLDTPPYESVDICPYCGAADFFEFDFFTEKQEVAGCILPALVCFNRCINSIKDMYGENACNKDLSNGVVMLAEFVSELFDYIPAEIDRKILTVSSDKECESILMYLRGEL